MLVVRGSGENRSGCSSYRARLVAPYVLACLMALALSLALPARRALARDYSIDVVTIDATIATDGTAAVHEERTLDFDGSFHGVYWKIPSGSSNNRQFEGTVSSVGEIVNGQYIEFTEDYSENDYTYQLSDYDGGVRVKLYSAHEDESAVFVLNYTITNTAVRYDDVSELYWKFVSEGGDVEAHNVTCTIHLPVPDGKKVEPEENVRAWSHAPLDASVHFDGNDIVYTLPGVGTSEFAEARITFPAEWLSAATSQGGRVLQDILSEERQWADEANTKRERARVLTYGGSGLAGLGTLLVLVLPIVARIRYRRSHKAQFDDKYFRDVPSNDHPAVLGALYRGGTPEGEDFTATLMRLTDLGAMSLELVTIESKGLLGRTKRRQDYCVTVSDQAADMALDQIDRRALLVLFEDIGRFAPSSRDVEGAEAGKTLFFSDLEKVAKKYPERYHDAFESWNAQVESQLAKRGFYKGTEKTGQAIAIACAILSALLFIGTVFLLIVSEAWTICIPLILLQIVACIASVLTAIANKSISEEAIELKAKLEALRRWFKDFTRLEEAVPRDVVLWNRLLVMAVVLGVADEVVEQLKMVAPELLESRNLEPTYGWYHVGPQGSPYRSFNTNYSDAHHVSSATLAASEFSSGGGGGGGSSGGGGGGVGGGGGFGAF